MPTLSEFLRQYATTLGTKPGPSELGGGRSLWEGEDFAEADLFNPQVQQAIMADPATFFSGVGQGGLTKYSTGPTEGGEGWTDITNPYWGSAIEGTGGAMSNLMPFNKFSVGAEGGYNNAGYQNAQWIPGKGVVLPANSQIAINEGDFGDVLLGAGAAGLGMLSGGFGLGDLMGSFSGGGTAPWGAGEAVSGSYAPAAGELAGYAQSYGTPNLWDAVANQGPLASGGGLEGVYSPETLGTDWASQGGGVDPSTWQSGTGGGDVGISNTLSNTPTPGYSPGGESVSGSWPVSPSELASAARSYSSSGILPQWAKDLGITGSDLVRAAGGLLSAGIGAYGASKAASAQEKAAQSALDLQKYMYDTTRADFEPWRTAGAAAVGRMGDLTTPGKQFDTMQADPGYQWRLGQGEQGINRGAAARGLWDSGRTMKALTDYNQNFATNEFGNVYNRNANLAGMGQVATQNTAEAGQNYANQGGNAITGAGNARASGYMGMANAFAGGLGNYLNNYNQQEMLDKLLRGGG